MNKSLKQTQFLREKHARINILSGAVRSGKTYISLYQFMLFVMARPREYEFILIGKTLTSLKRNCLGIMQSVSGGLFEYSASQKKAVLCGRTIWLEGANDDRSESKIRGMTLGGAYVDEATLIPRDFFSMLLSRLSLPKSRLYATTNPDNPMHWLKTEYIDNEKVDCATIHFTIDDNPFLDKTYIANLKKEYAGTVYYNRYILGEWKAADGAVYDMFDKDVHIFDDDNAGKIIGRRYITIDYGTTNPMVFLDIIDTGREIYAMREYYYDSRKKMRQKTDREYGDDFDDFVGHDHSLTVIIDPSAASFKNELRNRGYRTKDADNEVLEGIRMVSSMLNLRLLKVHESCINLIKEFLNYMWDEKAANRGEEKPMKQSDHALDSLRYFVKTVINRRRFLM